MGKKIIDDFQNNEGKNEEKKRYRITQFEKKIKNVFNNIFMINCVIGMKNIFLIGKKCRIIGKIYFMVKFNFYFIEYFLFMVKIGFNFQLKKRLMK